ncbi:MAG TPA: GNAT family N-acetyltransferase [Blastocatellia bacterium]|nr:GNAT family N-acetyltransferase [Blastocatellia bacterium]
MTTDVTTYYLEMTDRAELRPARPRSVELQVVRAELPCPELNRFLYSAVGGDWYWTDKLDWSYDRWLAYVDRPDFETWVGSVSGTPVGYFELEQEAGVKIAYFGLLPRFIGRGIGGALLTRAAERAWDLGAGRVWVHTCSLDGPGALPNYQARGFKIYQTEVACMELPNQSPGPWPGARTGTAEGWQNGD